MVAAFQDDVDLEDKPPSRSPLPTGPVLSENCTLPREEVAGHPKATALAPQKCSKPETEQYVGDPRGGAPGGGVEHTPDPSFS